MLFWHKRANKGREFIDASFVFDAVIRGNFHDKACWVEGDLLANLDATHRELEARTFHLSLLWFFMFAFHDGFIIFVKCYFSIVYCTGNIAEYVESHLWSHIEELSVLADAQIGETVNGLMHQLLHLIVFRALHCGKYLEG